MIGKTNILKTDVYFSQKENRLLIAYKNAKEQNVFLQILKADFAPSLEGILICDSTYNIEKVISNAFEFPVQKPRNMEIGVKIRHIWKPFMDNIQNELHFTTPELCRAKRELGILIQKLQEILLFVEPSPEGLKTYSHKIRELLILACTELENGFKFYRFGKNKGMKDYVEILKFVDLSKHKLSLVGYTNPYKCCPFENWIKDEPTKSLPWYDAYNKSKHNKDASFHLATLENTINAIAANIVLFAIRYSPAMLYNENDVCSNLVRSSLNFRLEETKDFYIPVFEGVTGYTGAFSQSQIFPNGQVIEHIYDQRILIPFTERLLK